MLSIRYRNILAMAVPISAGTLLQFLVLLTDNFFLSRLSEAAINGAGNAGLVYLTLQMLAVGSSTALQIVIARKIGEGQRDEALRTFRTGLLIHAVLGVCLMAVATGLNQGLLGSTLSNSDVRDVFEPYFQIRIFGFIPFSILLSFNALYTGTAKTWPILVVGVVTALLNVILDASWVEGWWGITPIGALGAAWASFAAESTGCVLALILTVRIFPLALRPWTLLNRESLLNWWRLAYPLMAQFITTIATWTAFFFFVEKVGTLELKVSHVTRNFFMLAFIVAQGMQQTTRTYVSGLLGEGRNDEIMQALKKIFILNLAGILLLCHGYVLYPELLASVFFDTTLGVESMVKTLHVIFVAVSVYSITGIMLATIQGSGGSKAAFRIELVSVTIYTLIAALMTLVWPQPIWIIWRVEWAYFLLIGFFSWLYLRKGTWKLSPYPNP